MTSTTRWATEPLFRVEHSADFPARDWLTLDPARPGEHPDVRRAQYRAVVDPLFDISNLRFTSLAFWE